MLYVKKDAGKSTDKTTIQKPFNGNVISSITHGIKNVMSTISFLTFITFFLGFIGVVGSFVIPIEAYANGSNLSQVIILSAVFALPSVFNIYLGKIADTNRKASLIGGLILSSISLGVLSFGGGFDYLLLFTFFLSIAINLSTLSLNGIATEIVKPKYYGRMSSVLVSSNSIGEFLGPIAIGILFDISSISIGFGILSVLTIFIALGAIFQKKHFQAIQRPLL